MASPSRTDDAVIVLWWKDAIVHRLDVETSVDSDAAQPGPVGGRSAGLAEPLPGQ